MFGHVRRLAVALAQAEPGAPVTGQVQPEIRVWFNARLESRYFMIPGIVALLLLVITTNLSAMAIVREKEIGTLEQLSVTPLARWELIAGKLLPYAAAAGRPGTEKLCSAAPTISIYITVTICIKNGDF